MSNDAVASGTPVAPGGASAGARLRAAREAAGLPLEALASLLKVPVGKLEALEGDRYEQLPGMAFVRGLARSYCRQLQVDPSPVLALLPQAETSPDSLESVTRGLATRFREPSHRGIPGAGWLPLEWPAWARPSVLASALLILLALVFWFMPSGRLLLGSVPGAAVVTEAASAAMGAVTAASDAGTVVETVHSAPFDDTQPSTSAAAGSAPAPATGGAVSLRTTAESWVEVRDSKGGVLLSRMLVPGETVGLDGELPLRLKIGNADGTRLAFHGQPIDLVPYTRDNVARVELK